LTPSLRPRASLPENHFESSLKQPATSANAADAISRKLAQLENAKISAVREVALEDGRILYYGAEIPARTAGPTRGAALVTEYNSASGKVRVYYESYDQTGAPVRVHPKLINGQLVTSQHYPPTGKELGR